MSAAYELAAWFTFIGAILGAAGMAFAYERLLRRAQDDHDADLAANDAHQKKVTAEAVAKVRHFWRGRVATAERTGYERGWREANAVWRVTYEARDRIDRHLTSLPVLTDDELKAIFDGEGSA